MPRLPRKPHTEVLKRIGENVRSERLRLGLTQEGLAEKVDLHPRVVQKIEAGKTNILVTTAMRLRAAFGCDWTILLPPVNPFSGVLEGESPSGSRRQ